jgi:hypothetical protein
MARPQNVGRKQRAPSVEITKPPRSVSIGHLLDRRAKFFVLALLALGTLRIASTYTVFTHTIDEPVHIACGMEWLSKGVYQYETQHPPLTRIMVALGPYLLGVRTMGQKDMLLEGPLLLYTGGQYDVRLALSRAGNLPFFWLACWMVFLWGSRLLGTAGGVVSVLMFTMIPTVLAHAGLSTTDMGVTAGFAAATYASVRLAEQPSLRTAIWLGLALGLMVLTKFSALPYFAVAAVAVTAWWLYSARPARQRLGSRLLACLPWLGLSALLCFLIIWSGYRFSFGKDPWFPFPVPFPELYSGIREVMDHNAKGHMSYLLGEMRTDGWWAYFPILIAVKLPLAFLALAAFGLWRGAAARPEPATDAAASWPFALAWLIPAAILAVALSARINIGLRHILPAFPFFAILAGAGALWLLHQGDHSRYMRWTVAALAAWLCISSLIAHPDYLAYFNAIAGSEPEKIVVDSDLDWGQDIKRLGERLRELNATSVTFSTVSLYSLPTHGFPPTQMSSPNAPAPGWNAVEVTEWKLFRMNLPLELRASSHVWPDFIKPAERVGKSILLYYISPRTTQTPRPSRPF